MRNLRVFEIEYALRQKQLRRCRMSREERKRNRKYLREQLGISRSKPVCEICGEETNEKRVMETVLIQFPFRSAAHTYFDRDGAKITKDDPGGKGLQIAREGYAHSECA